MKKIKVTKRQVLFSIIRIVVFGFAICITSLVSANYFHVHNVDECFACKTNRIKYCYEGYKEKEKEDESQIRNLKRDSKNNREKAEFLDNHIVLVTEGGQKYHRYNCQYVKGKTFWAYNHEAAKSRGYTACSTCNPPQ